MLFPRFQPSGHISLTRPQADLRAISSSLGFGLDITLAYHFKNTPLSLGSEISYVSFDTDGNNVQTSLNPDKSTAITNALMTHLLFRYQQTNKWKYLPYFDFFVGVTHLSSEQNINRGAGTGTSLSNSDSDVVFSYGAGFGFAVPLIFGNKTKAGQFKSLYLDLQLRFLLGGKTRSVGIENSGNGAVKDEAISSNLLVFRASITYEF